MSYVVAGIMVTILSVGYYTCTKLLKQAEVKPRGEVTPYIYLMDLRDSRIESRASVKKETKTQNIT
jgi:hypothetical protein